MDGSGGSFALLKFLFPQIPTLTTTALWHTLGQTPTSSKWDLQTALTVQVLRSLMSGKPVPIGKAQASTLKDPGVKGKTWVAKATIPAPASADEGVREAVFQAVEKMKGEELRYEKPDLVDVEVEWTGYRPDAGKTDPMPDISEQERYDHLMAEPTRTSETTILYFHGGAYYLCDPSTHRSVTSRLAKESHGRVCSVRYRLAPQTAFPGQLLDALLVYLSLLYPPPGSLHTATPATKIVFGGDSAGGNLSFALLQFLLQLHREAKSQTPTVLFHGREVSVPLPAGATANSGWFDITRAFPSITSNAQFDYLPPVQHDENIASRFPADSVWPAHPPRGDLFCDLSLLDHPLASVAAAQSWEGSPPLYLCTGQEMLTDEEKIVAATAARQGVKVRWEQYEAMPHVFAMLLPALKTSDQCLRSWGEFCRRCVEEPEGLKTEGTFTYSKTGKDEVVDVETLSGISVDEARVMMREVKERKQVAFAAGDKKAPKSAL